MHQCNMKVIVQKQRGRSGNEDSAKVIYLSLNVALGAS